MQALRSFFIGPRRDAALFAFCGAVLLSHIFLPGRFASVLVAAALLAAMPTLWGAAQALRQGRLIIDTFNVFAVVVSVSLGEGASAAFIGLMLTSARLLEWRTASRTQDAVAALMRLRPDTAIRERGRKLQTVPVASVEVGDVLVLRAGNRAAVDGVVIYGSGAVNESAMTGESRFVDKTIGDRIVSGTVLETGAMKFRARRVGQDTTLSRMALLVRDAASHKSRPERAADQFAAIFLPLVGLAGLVVYLATQRWDMVAALFLVACADDMAVAIPLAMTAALGQAAARGVLVKGGEWLDALARARILVLDKTGTLTFGQMRVARVVREPWCTERRFWTAVASLEKYAEHPVARAVFVEARQHLRRIPDPRRVEVIRGAGIAGQVGPDAVAVGTVTALRHAGVRMTRRQGARMRATERRGLGSWLWVAINGRVAGFCTVADTPRPEAARSLAALRGLGMKEQVMLTGDRRAPAEAVATALGLTSFRSGVSPAEKVRAVAGYAQRGVVAMVGDGVNDAAALSRAHVGIAMGAGGTAVAVDAADVVVLSDTLESLPAVVALAKRTRGVVYADMGIWALTNVVGIGLVLSGQVGPAGAALFNFLTDFLPLLNSARLFRGGPKDDGKKKKPAAASV